jgi:NADPH:quinone reductase-like Zn-dependent oxidoreductase
MKVMQFTEYGAAPVLNNVAEPAVGEGDVLVRVAGAALNPMDVKLGLGCLHEHYPITFPATVGTDVSGTVERAGAQVTGWAAGDRVIARLDPSVGGAVAELAVVPAVQLVRAPESVPLTVASGLATAAATAYQALAELGEIREGQRVLMHGGAGGVGAFAVQIARRLGAHVATTVSPRSIDLAAGLGADQVIDYTTTDFRTLVSDIDLVIDPIGGDTELASLDVLKPGGLLLGLNMPPDVDRAASRGLRAQFLFHTAHADRLAKVAALADNGLEIPVDRQVSLADAIEAYEHVASGHAKGKVIVAPR